MPTPSRRRWILAWIIGGTLLLLLLWAILDALIFAAFGDLVWWPATGYPFPEPSQIASMHVVSWHDPNRASGRGSWKFDIPEQFWSGVIDGLSPSQRDKHPLKWTLNGEIEVVLKNDDRFVVDVYYLGGRGAGAFSAGPTFKSRVYYRGGKSDRIAQVIREAHSAVAEGAAPDSAERLEPATDP